LSQGDFTQTDPMPYGPGTSFESSYVYSRNMPLTFKDPNGQRASSSSTSYDPAGNPITTTVSPDGKNVSVGGVVIYAGVRIPGVGWCVGTCKKPSAVATVIGDPAANTYYYAVKEAGANSLGAGGLIKLDQVHKAYRECFKKNRNDGKCIEKLVFATLALGPPGTVVGAVMGGPAHAALYSLIDKTTQFAVDQLSAVIDGFAKTGAKETAVKSGAGEMSVLTYDDGTVYARNTEENNFFHRVGEK
jgi:hypothetical protein